MLDSKAKKLLKLVIKKCNGDTGKCVEISAEELSITIDTLNSLCHSLYQEGYFSSAFYCYGPKDPAEIYLSYKGLTVFKELRKKILWYWLPVALNTVLSVAAIIISIIALNKG